jgi:hypothetical protein
MKLFTSAFALLLLVLGLGQAGAQVTCTDIPPVRARASSGDARQAVDNIAGSRWESLHADPQWLVVDLGQVYNVNQVRILWEVANAATYNLLGSADSVAWDTLVQFSGGMQGNRTDLFDTLSGQYRYLMMDGFTRSTGWGYSIFEFEVCGSSITAINKPQNQQLLPLYPNPTKGAVKLEAAQAGAYRVTDLQGRLVKAGDLQKGANTIALGELKPGVYLVQAGGQVNRLVLED